MGKVSDRQEVTLDCGPKVEELVADVHRLAREAFGRRFAHLGGQGYNVSTSSGAVVPQLVVMVFPERQARDAQKALGRLKEQGEITSIADWSEGIPSDHKVPLLNTGKKKGSQTKTLLAVWLGTAHEAASRQALDTLKKRIQHMVDGHGGMRIISEEGTKFVISASGKIPNSLRQHGHFVP